MQSTFIESIIQKAWESRKRIVFPEGAEERILRAAKIVADKGIADVVLLGNKDIIDQKMRELFGSPVDLTIVDPQTYSHLDDYCQTYYDLRKKRGITEQQAYEDMRAVTYFGAMYVHKGEADGFISGSTHSTADTIRPVLRIIKAGPQSQYVSSVFFMLIDGAVYLFADCALIENPTARQLSSIALETIRTARQFGLDKRCALLSYSTKGSSSSPSIQKVAEATDRIRNLVQEQFPGEDILVDGELQLDAAIVPLVARKKCPNSVLKGTANILIFPDLNSGNIGYKLVQRMANAEAYGPILQGLAKPANDLSRGCCVEDVVGVTAITAVQAQNAEAKETAH